MKKAALSLSLLALLSTSAIAGPHTRCASAVKDAVESEDHDASVIKISSRDGVEYRVETQFDNGDALIYNYLQVTVNPSTCKVLSIVDPKAH